MKHSLWALVLLAAVPAAWPQGVPSGGPVYRCPGPPILYTDQITEREAKEKNCRTIEGAPVTIMQSPKQAAPARSKEPIASGPREGKVDPNAQRQRDGDARKLLEGELRREEGRLADLRKEYNNGEPERQGSERNYQRYADRVDEMRMAITRKEEDIAAIKRELAKLQ